MHLAIIMDGNGRWAKKRNLPRPAGHLEGLKTCKYIVKEVSKLDIDYLTLYVFSTENNKRPVQEVNYLMNLIANKLPDEVPFFNTYNIKILSKGDISSLPTLAANGVYKTIKNTENNTGLKVVLAINYGGQDEIVRAVNRALEYKLVKSKRSSTGMDAGLGNLGYAGLKQADLEQVDLGHADLKQADLGYAGLITISDINNNLDYPEIPPPDLIVRTAGEKRLSNFLLWESAYSELYFSDKLWPDWDRSDIIKCLDEYNSRNRKFGNV